MFDPENNEEEIEETDSDFDDDFDFDDNDSYGSIGWGTDEYYEYGG